MDVLPRPCPEWDSAAVNQWPDRPATRGRLIVLEKFGVSPQAEASYLELVHRDIRSHDELALSVGLTAEGAADVLAELLRHGLLVEDDREPLGFRLLAPHHGLDVLIRREEERLERERAVLEQSREGVGDLLANFVQARVRRSGELIETIEDSSVVRARLYQLVHEATSWVWATHPGAALSPSATSESLALDRYLADTGVDYRLLVARESFGPSYWTGYVDAIHALGHRVRTLTAIPILMVVIDGAFAVVPSRSETGQTGAHVLHGPSVIAPVVALFEELWVSATPYEAAASVESSGDGRVSLERMRQVAVLMASGMKDETIARRLGVSARTVRRIVAAMLDHLNADSRFQAACRAVEAGWITPAGKGAASDEGPRGGDVSGPQAQR